MTDDLTRQKIVFDLKQQTVFNSAIAKLVAERYDATPRQVIASGIRAGLLFDSGSKMTPKEAAKAFVDAPAPSERQLRASAREARVVPPSKTITCSLCKTSGIEHGASVCRGCGAVISYRQHNSSDGDAKFMGWLFAIGAGIVSFGLFAILMRVGDLELSSGAAAGITVVVGAIAGFIGWSKAKNADRGTEVTIAEFKVPSNTSVGVGFISSGD